MRLLFLSFHLLFAFSGFGKQIQSLDDYLKNLDEVILQRHIYSDVKTRRIEEIKTQLRYVNTDEQYFNVYRDLMNEYRSFKTDSCLISAQYKLQYALRMGKKEYIDDARLNIIEVMNVTGMYKEAYDLLAEIDSENLADHLRPYYYHLYRTLYGFMADHSVFAEEKQKYEEQCSVYRDSILMSNDENSLVYALVKADDQVYRKEYDLAFKTLNQYALTNQLQDHDLALISYCLADVYRCMGDSVNEQRYLAVSSINDLKSSVKEYISLSRLAVLMYRSGQIKRAYNYLKCAMEDATFCSARIRTIEASTYFPIIEKAYQTETNRQKKQLTRMLLGISILSFFLILTIIIVGIQIRKLRKIRRNLSHANGSLHLLNGELSVYNDRLKRLNDHLQDSNFIKEEYIGRYMDLCSSYLEKLDSYRKGLCRIASTNKTEDLFREIKSKQFIEDELKNFYANFDNTFLNIFPDFVADFNKLLVEEEHIVLKQNELLNTELRIYALIRLGITDSVKIAHFLRYSVTTIYNYRTKTRNKAIGERSEFENKVMQIGGNSIL